MQQQYWYADKYLSWPLVVLGGAVLIALAVLIGMYPQSFFLYLAGELVVAFVLMNFYELRVAADEKTLYIEFGIGLLRREIPIFRVQNVLQVPNENIISLLYAPTARRVLKITMREGSTFTVPSSDPKDLASALISRGAGHQH